MEPRKLKVIFSEIYLMNYDTVGCECPDRVRSILKSLAPHYEILTPQPAQDEDILLVHTQSILREVKKDPTLYEAACMAAGGTLLAAELACEGTPAFAAVRPPGHHASPDGHWGFCFFNNVAIAVEKLIRLKKINTALILDIDLHFGDGSENAFRHRPDVIVENIQEDDRQRFLSAADKALSKNTYDIIAVSAGFDRHRQDWGATLTTEDYFTIGRSVRDMAMAQCGGRYFAVLEGGYNTSVLGENALALCRGMDPSQEP